MIESIADECVADGNFFDPREVRREKGEVLEAEVVPSVDAESETFGQPCSFDEGGYGMVAVVVVLAGVGFGVEFDAVGACFGGPSDVVGISLYEE